MNLKKSKFLSSATEEAEQQLTSTILKTESAHVKMALLPIDELKPHEKGSQIYLELLKQEILKDGMLKYPIVADEKSHVILDGMHRWLAMKSLGYMLIPVILVDARRNSGTRIGTRRIHRYTIDADKEMSIERVISAGLSRRLMEPRSTRHFFPFSKFQKINYPLRLLRKDLPQDISKYISEMTPEESNFVIKEWLKEMSEELEFLAERKEEVEREKAEFMNRVKNLENGFSPH